ncbi:hypothetical protein D3C80_692610 [compost metagenome]
MAHLQHRRVVAGKEHVAHAIGAAELGQADAVLGDMGRITAIGHPAGELAIELAVATGHLAGALQHQPALGAELAEIRRLSAVDAFDPHQIGWQGTVQILLAQILRHLAVQKASGFGLLLGHLGRVRVARTTGQPDHSGGQPVRVFFHMSSSNRKTLTP